MMHQTAHAPIPLRPRPRQLDLVPRQHRTQLDIPRPRPAIRLQRDRPYTQRYVLQRDLGHDRRRPLVFRRARRHLVCRQPA